MDWPLRSGHVSNRRVFAMAGVILLVLIFGLASQRVGLLVLGFILFVAIVVLLIFLQSVNRREL